MSRFIFKGFLSAYLIREVVRLWRFYSQGMVGNTWGALRFRLPSFFNQLCGFTPFELSLARKRRGQTSAERSWNTTLSEGATGMGNTRLADGKESHHSHFASGCVCVWGERQSGHRTVLQGTVRRATGEHQLKEQWGLFYTQLINGKTKLPYFLCGEVFFGEHIKRNTDNEQKKKSSQGVAGVGASGKEKTRTAQHLEDGWYDLTTTPL